MYLLLQFSFIRFEIKQGSYIGYKHYGLWFFWRSNQFWIFWIFEIVIKYILTVKCISSYNFHSIVLKVYRALLQNMRIMACDFFWRSNHFWIFGEFLIFWNIGIIYSNYEMYLLQFSLNRYEIMQGFSIGYRRYGLCF